MNVSIDISKDGADAIDGIIETIRKLKDLHGIDLPQHQSTSEEEEVSNAKDFIHRMSISSPCPYCNQPLNVQAFCFSHHCASLNTSVYADSWVELAQAARDNLPQGTDKFPLASTSLTMATFRNNAAIIKINFPAFDHRTRTSVIRFAKQMWEQYEHWLISTESDYPLLEITIKSASHGYVSVREEMGRIPYKLPVVCYVPHLADRLFPLSPAIVRFQVMFNRFSFGRFDDCFDALDIESAFNSL